MLILSSSLASLFLSTRAFEITNYGRGLPHLCILQCDGECQTAGRETPGRQPGACDAPKKIRSGQH